MTFARSFIIADLTLASRKIIPEAWYDLFASERISSMSRENCGIWNGTGHGAERHESGRIMVSFELDDAQTWMYRHLGGRCPHHYLLDGYPVNLENSMERTILMHLVGVGQGWTPFLFKSLSPSPCRIGQQLKSHWKTGFQNLCLRIIIQIPLVTGSFHQPLQQDPPLYLEFLLEVSTCVCHVLPIWLVNGPPLLFGACCPQLKREKKINQDSVLIVKLFCLAKTILNCLQKMWINTQHPLFHDFSFYFFLLTFSLIKAILNIIVLHRNCRLKWVYKNIKKYACTVFVSEQQLYSQL